MKYGEKEQGASPSAWLFAHQILARPIPKIVRADTQARAKRAELERLAAISTRAADELRDLVYAEDQARL